MEVAICLRCKTMFNHVSGLRYCPRCKDWLELKFKEVKDYIQDHKESTMEEVSTECEISVKVLKQWIREDRIQMSTANGDVVCDSCGRPIASGRMCETCKDTLLKSIQGIAPAKTIAEGPKKKQAARMRFLDN